MNVVWERNYEALGLAREQYSKKLALAQALEGEALASAVAELRQLARETNDALGEFSSELGQGLAIDTESLLMLELTKSGEPKT